MKFFEKTGIRFAKSLYQNFPALKDMFLCDTKNVSQEVLRYLLRHPNAQDTLEGISEWWILEERIIQKYAEVQEALKTLVEQGFVLEKEMPNGRVIYCLNKDKKNSIREFISNEENLK